MKNIIRFLPYFYHLIIIYFIKLKITFKNQKNVIKNQMTSVLIISFGPVQKIYDELDKLHIFPELLYVLS